jgi:DNA-directed RNA polymerase specialized sigma24 family protein
MADSGAVFADFYAMEVAPALRLAWLLTHDTELSRDVVQDAFAALFERFSRVERPLPYLRRSIINGVRQRARAGEREARRMQICAVTVPDGTPGPTGGMIDVIGSLSPRQRIVVVLRYWAQLSDGEIAEVLSCPAGTVRSLATRALTRLRNELM